MIEIDEKIVSKFITKYTSKAKSREENRPGYFVWLNIGHQKFRMFEPIETAKQANWYRRQLAIALTNVASGE